MFGRIRRMIKTIGHGVKSGFHTAHRAIKHVKHFGKAVGETLDSFGPLGSALKTAGMHAGMSMAEKHRIGGHSLKELAEKADRGIALGDRAMHGDRRAIGELAAPGVRKATEMLNEYARHSRARYA